MVCLYCGQATRVANSRIQKRQNTIWRRRICDSCSGVFTTREFPVLAQSVLIHHANDKKLQPFSRDRLFLSIFEVCKHRDRAIVESDALTETIMAIVLKNLRDGVVERDLVAHTANTVLNRFDGVAASLYAAYHPLSMQTSLHKSTTRNL